MYLILYRISLHELVNFGEVASFAHLLRVNSAHPLPEILGPPRYCQKLATGGDLCRGYRLVIPFRRQRSLTMVSSPASTNAHRRRSKISHLLRENRCTEYEDIVERYVVLV